MEYFAKHWRFHTLACSDSPRVQAAVIKFMSSDPHRINHRQISRFIAGYRKHYYAAEEAASTHTLHMLASLGHTKIFKQALTLHMDKINLQTALVGHTPIITAAAAGHVDITRHLLRHGADPLIPNWYGNALHCAAEANKASTITVLLEAGVDPDTRTATGATPLGCTADNDAADAAAVLLSRVVDPMDFDSKRDKNLLFAAVQDTARASSPSSSRGDAWTSKPKEAISGSLLCARLH